QRACNGVRRTISDSAQTPVVFNEPQDGRLISDRVIDEVRLGPGRNDQQRQTRAKAAAAILGSPAYVVSLWRAAIAGAEKVIVRTIGLDDDGTHLVIVPAIGIIPSDNYRRAVPSRALHEGVDDADHEVLFVDRVRVPGMAVLVGSRFNVANGGKVA